jgi:hypothetical protein
MEGDSGRAANITRREAGLSFQRWAVMMRHPIGNQFAWAE